MPRGSKKSYTKKQKRKAEHIEQGYKKRGTSSKEAERRAWATVNKQDGGGKKKKSRKRTAAKGRRKAKRSTRSSSKSRSKKSS